MYTEKYNYPIIGAKFCYLNMIEFVHVASLSNKLLDLWN